MSQHQDTHSAASNHGHHGFPWQYVIGFILSLILTIIPLELVLHHVIAMSPLIWAILACAVLQIVVQLFMFMHFTDTGGSGPAYQTITVTIGILFAFLFILASAWIMSFGSQVS